MSVNVDPLSDGKSVVAKWLQRAMGLKDDGVIGPKTLGAIAACKDIPDLINFPFHLT
ncbi:MAG: hypothetical protein LLF99_06795 [Desulfobacteraceae bacterium]|nr:hypothetical protein [Desulfobacteraceae bacterium]